jgi:outer membrane lipoprotein-sorting protein
MKKLFLSALVILISIPAIANNDVYVQKAEQWIANLDTATARFEQVDYQGNALRGTFYINRPGRLRFEYDAPIKDYIVADGYQIHFFDGQSEQVASGPIGSTLADFILRDGTAFDDRVTIESVRELGDTVSIKLSQIDQPGMGELILNFAKEPFELSSWRIIDAQGLTTDIILSTFDREAPIAPKLFKMNNRILND